MTRLPDNLRKNRFDYKLYHREEVEDRAIAVYAQYSGDDVIAYEVFIVPIRKKDVLTPTKVLLPAGEVYPGNEYFGSLGKVVNNWKGHEKDVVDKIMVYFEQFKKHIKDGL